MVDVLVTNGPVLIAIAAAFGFNGMGYWRQRRR